MRRSMVDRWVQGEVRFVRFKRLTLDLPDEVYKAIKHKAINEGTSMTELLRALLEKHFLDP